MHIAAFVTLGLSILLATSCRAADNGNPSSTAPASQPAGLTATMAVTHVGNVWAAVITFRNPTDHALAMGHYASFSLTRTDEGEPKVVAASPKDMMSPHFRVLIPPGGTREVSVTFWSDPKPLPPGTYDAIVSFPPDVYAKEEVSKEFTVSPTTQPAQP